MTIEEIKAYLPHRFPFLLIDRVMSYEKGVSLTALKNVTMNEPFFTGHFPKKSVMPGVLMLEAMAQASGIMMFKDVGADPNEIPLVYLAGFDNVRFKRIVIPGDQLQIRVEVLKARRDLWKFSGTASVEGEMACMAELMVVKGAE